MTTTTLVADFLKSKRKIPDLNTKNVSTRKMVVNMIISGPPNLPLMTRYHTLGNQPGGLGQDIELTSLSIIEKIKKLDFPLTGTFCPFYNREAG
jgi:hypothetical protein